MKSLVLVAALGLVGLSACVSSGSSSTATANLPTLSVAFAGNEWNGEKIPDGQQCSYFGGRGSTPPLTVSGVPESTTEIVVEYNDESYPDLSYDGGHGKVGFRATVGTTQIPAIPGETNALPDGARIVASHRATGSLARPGYLPPCSGGNGNRYSADVKAVDSAGTVLATGEITLGLY